MPLVVQVLPSLLALVGLALWGYTLVTGRWIRWPIRPKRVPDTPRRRRLIASGITLALLSVLITNQNQLLDAHAGGARFVVGLVASGVAVVLALAGLVLVLANLNGKSDSPKQYHLHGWPPPRESGRRQPGGSGR